MGDYKTHKLNQWQYHNGGKKELELFCYEVMHSMWTGTVFENRLVKMYIVYDRTTFKLF